MTQFKFKGQLSEYDISSPLNGGLFILDKLPNRDGLNIISDLNSILIFQDSSFEAFKLLENNTDTAKTSKQNTAKEHLDNENTLNSHKKTTQNTIKAKEISLFKKNFSIIQHKSNYELIEFGQQVPIPDRAQNVKINIYGYDERVDSVIFDVNLIGEDLEYHYAILNDSFSLRLNGDMTALQLSALLASFALAVYCICPRRVEIKASIDDELVFNKEYDCKKI